MANTLRLTAKDFEARISYPPRRKKAAPLPPVRCPDSHRLLQQYQETMRDKKKRDAREAPMLNFSLQATATVAKESSTTQRLVTDGRGLYEKGCDVLSAGGAAEGRQMLDDAAAVLKEAVRLGVDTPDVYTLIGDVFRRRDMPQDAADYYSKALTLIGDAFTEGDWSGVRLFRDRAECYTEMGLEAAPKAAAEYDNYMQVAEPTFDTLLSAGKAHLDSGNLRRAGTLFEAALEKQEASSLLHYYLGELRERESSMGRARKHFARAVQVDPDFSKPYREQAEAHIAKGDGPSLWAALSLCQSVLKLHPEDALLYVRLADVYDMLGSDYVSQSVAMLDSALQLSLPQKVNEDSLVRRGELKLNAFGHVDAAIADFTQCLLLNPEHPRGLERRASVLLRRGQSGDLCAAAQDFEVLVSLPPEVVPQERKAQPYFFLAEWSFDRRFDGPDPAEQPAEAAEHYHRSLSKAASYFAACRLRGGSAEDAFDRKTRAGRHLIEKVVLSVAESNGYLLRPPPPPAQDGGRPVSGGKGDKGGQLSEAELDDALRCEPLTLRFVTEHYQWQKSTEPTCHTPLFYELQDGPPGLPYLGFKAFLEDVERKRAAAEQMRGGKKGKKR